MGGKVSSRPTISKANAIALTFPRATVFVPQRRARANHYTSQMMMASVDTPESVPTGL